jgi:ketosteroid isomerase-like protein
MKMRSLLVAASALAAVSLATAIVLAQQKPVPPDASEEAIRKAVLDTNAKMTQAGNRLDVDAFFSYILDTDRGMIIQNGTLFKTRQEAKEAVRRGLQGVAKVDRQFINPQVTVISPDVALLASEGTVTATLTDGRTRERRFAVSLVFVRRGAEWKLLHGHYSMPVGT